MGKYFGTDGFRGKAGVDLNSEHAFRIGRILGKLAMDAAPEGERASIVIGRDTRRSGSSLEQALAGGISASGCDAYLLGVISTPGVAYITRTHPYDFAFGVMISASHNPYADNGIKVLNSKGEKLEDDVIAIIERYLDGVPAQLPFASDDAIGVCINLAQADRDYADYLVSLVGEGAFAGMRIALDCANGSASEWAGQIYSRLGAEVLVINNAPDGLNINVACGSTHIGGLQKFVVDKNCHMGFAYDGDADRCLAVNSRGELVDGDQLMYLAACYLKSQGRLNNNTVVTTIMSNFGLYKALDAAGIAYEKTAVGDKYVYENMAENDHSIGGEQSGHIIFREFATTGDGMMTSILVTDAIIKSGKSMEELVAPMTVFPQVLKNVRVQSKEAALEDADVKAAISAASEALAGDGRVLVRKSGTEPLIRVMAEASSEEVCEQQVDAIIAVMKDKGHVVA